MQKYCGSCGFRVQEIGCARHNRKIDPKKDFCSDHSREVQRCDRCGKIVTQTILTKDKDDWEILCSTCLQNINTCTDCAHGNLCDFETNPSPIPKRIQKVESNGIMQVVTEAINPERIEITCKANKCPCYSEEFECFKHYNWCGNHARR